jgi:tetratricopeptide (TPR) repeat protein
MYSRGLGVTSTDLQTQARALYARGQAAYDAGRFQDALSAFESAYRTYTNPVVLVTIGQTLVRLGRLDEAAAKFREYLLRDPSGPQAETARARLAEIAPPEVPLSPSVPSSLKPGTTAAPAELPSVAEAYDTRGSAIGVWVATGVGVVGLIGLGFWLSRSKKPTANRRRARRRR